MYRTMRNRIHKVRQDEAGFTLIELLLVIVILGVLAAVVVFSVSGINDRGDIAACKTNVSTTETAVEAAYARDGEYPDTLAALVPDFLKSDPSDADGDDAVDPKVRVGYNADLGTVTPGTACD